MFHDTEFSGYCVMSVCESQPNLVAIGNLKGLVKLFSISDEGQLECGVETYCYSHTRFYELTRKIYVHAVEPLYKGHFGMSSFSFLNILGTCPLL